MPKAYRIGTKLECRVYNILLHRGGVGDLIACLPAIKYILDTHPQIQLLLWVQDYGVELCRKIFASYPNIDINGMSISHKFYKDELPCRSPHIHKISNLSIHMVDHAFYTMVHMQVENKYKNYIQLDPIDISEFNLPEKYVVIATGFTSPTREWKPQSVKEVSDYCITKGYTPVYLGRTQTPATTDHVIKGAFLADYSNGINLIDKTDLFQGHAIMANSKVVVGLDNGLLHLAAMSKVPIVYGLTTLLPEHRLPYREDILGKDCYVVTPTEQELRCIGCQSKMNFLPTDKNFTQCFYDDFKCLDLMTSDRWIEQLEKIL